jgi:hypothetical protein
MADPYIQHRIYLQQFSLLKNRKGFEIAPVNFNYQDIIIVATGLIEYGGGQFVFQSNSCGCGPQPTIRGAYLEEVILWENSDLYAWFAACKTKDCKLVGQKVINEVYRVRLPVDEKEKAEVTAALRSHFGAGTDISFF